MRQAFIERQTRETSIRLQLNLDGTGKAELKTGVPFLEHMLEQICAHVLIDIKLYAEGDLEVDLHHTVEDIGIVLGQGLKKALGDKKGIQRYGFSYVPLDEALSRVVLDLSGRPGLYYFVNYTRDRIGTFDTQLIEEFFHGLCNHALFTLHIDNLRGNNVHHQAETLFKAFARALRMAITLDPKFTHVPPSTKGVL